MSIRESESVVFEVTHSYEYENDLFGTEEAVRVIGYFDSESKAKAAVESLVALPGFRSHPDGFFIDRCVVGRTGWTSGFEIVSVERSGE